MEQHDEVERKFAEEHRAAVESMAAERYVLGEMEPAERDAFEDHFFDCAECSSDVRDETKIGAGVTTEEAHTGHRTGRFNGWAVAASMLVASLAVENAVLIPRLTHVQTPPAKTEPAGSFAHIVPFDGERGGSVVIRIHSSDSLILNGPIPPANAHQPIYIFVVRDEAQHTRELNRFAELDTAAPVLITVRPGFLTNGTYTLLLRGGEREVALSTFTVEVR